MRKIFHLSNCSTCKKIIAQTQAASVCTLQDIKTEQISAEELDWIAQKMGSYEAIFSRKAMKYRAMGLHEKTLTEQDYRQLMLEEYTFLKRPFIVVDDQVFVGNTNKTVADATDAIANAKK